MLDVGSGSGYLTMLAAHLVGECGSCTGIEVQSSHMAMWACIQGTWLFAAGVALTRCRGWPAPCAVVLFGNADEDLSSLL